MPEMAELVFNRCMEVDPGTGRRQIWKNLDEVTRKTLEAEALAVRFNFDFMDDEFIIREWDKEWFYYNIEKNVKWRSIIIIRL